MRLDAPVLLYGAGREGRSTRAFLKARAPQLKVYVTVDAGEADIKDAEFIAPTELQAAIETSLESAFAASDMHPTPTPASRARMAGAILYAIAIRARLGAKAGDLKVFAASMVPTICA